MTNDELLNLIEEVDKEQASKQEQLQVLPQEEVPPEQAPLLNPEEVDKVREAPAGYEGVVMFSQDVLDEAARKHRIVLEGVCSHCAHCSLKLTDAISVQRGIGPICSKKGYTEEPEGSCDPIEAMIMLGKWPHLVDYLVKNAGGVEKGHAHKLMNGIVRICSLNRRTEVHDACTDALDALGFYTLASKLRETLCIASIKESEGNPNFFAIWIKKSEYNPRWAYEFRQAFPATYFSKTDKGMVFPKAEKRKVWDLLNKFYSGLCLKTPDGKAVRIKKKESATSN